jgi:uncharacterized protein YutE (UPF0331/DUF86 family)
MVLSEVVRKRLHKLDEYLNILKRMQRYSYTEFSRNPEKYGSVERFLLLAIEATLDIGNHIIADLNLGTVNWYSDIPQIFFKAEYLDEGLMNTWIKMIGFRNTLVHDYIEIDKKIVYSVLQSNLPDFEKLKQVFATFL